MFSLLGLGQLCGHLQIWFGLGGGFFLWRGLRSTVAPFRMAGPMRWWFSGAASEKERASAARVHGT